MLMSLCTRTTLSDSSSADAAVEALRVGAPARGLDGHGEVLEDRVVEAVLAAEALVDVAKERHRTRRPG